MKCDVYNKECFSPVCSAISGQDDCPNRLRLEVEQLKKNVDILEKATGMAARELMEKDKEIAEEKKQKAAALHILTQKDKAIEKAVEELFKSEIASSIDQAQYHIRAAKRSIAQESLTKPDTKGGTHHDNSRTN